MVALKLKLLRAVRTKKINIFLLFVVLAFMILLLTKLSSDYTNTVIFNVRSNNLPDTAVILKDSTHQLKVTLRTYGFNWLNYYFFEPSLDIDFKNDVTKTDSIFIWSTAKGFSTINNQFEKSVKVMSINPDTLKFKYDINAVKYVPVKPNLDITYSPGYNVLEGEKIDLDSVKVIGPKSFLSTINHIETKLFKAENVRQPIKETVLLNLDSLDPSITIATNKIVLTSKVERFTEGTLSIPIEVINIPRTISLTHFPKALNVYYLTSLEKFNSINKNDFKVVCDYNELTNNSTYLNPKLIKLPSKIIKHVKLQQQNIEFIITK